MNTLRFFSRVALICNVCFLAAIVLLRMKDPPSGMLTSMVMIMGTLLAIGFNVLVNAAYIWLLVARKPVRRIVPGWLVVVNFLFLIPQLILLLK